MSGQSNKRSVLQDTSGYSLNDFLLYSSETYTALVSDFVAHYILLLLLPLASGLLLGAVYGKGQQLKRHLFFLTLITVKLPLALFYLSHYSQIQTFFIWYLGATFVQILLTLIVAFRFMQVKGMALFTIKDLLPDQRAFNTIILATLLIQLALISSNWQENALQGLFMPATYWWTMTMLLLFSSANIRVWLLPIPLIITITEVATLHLMGFPFVWLYWLLPVVIFVSSQVQPPKRL